MSWSIYFNDPEGNGIEVYCDSPWYVSQPRAVPFDIFSDGEQIRSETAALVHRDPSGLPVEQWRAQVEDRLTQTSG